MKNIPKNPESEPKPITRLDRRTSPLAGICFALFLFGSVTTTSYALLNQNLKLMPEEVTWATFLNGDISSGIANALANAPVPNNAAQFERGFSWLVTRDLGPRVREGKDDWLFLNDELVIHQDRVSSANERSRQIVKIEKQLSSRGIGLLVILVPDKSRTVPEYLGTQHRSNILESRVSDFAKTLSKSSIDVINLTDPLSAAKQNGLAPFLRTDTHWTEQGAQVAAKVVAQRIQSLKMNPLPVQTTQISSQVEEIRLGDLVKLAGIDWLPKHLQPTPEIAQHSTFSSGQVKSSKKSSNALDDLFGDENLPNIAVIGTSFSRTSQFISFLEMQLNTKIGNFAIDGGDFTGSAKAYFNSPSFKDTPPKLVLWEIPERVIEMDRKNDVQLTIK